MKLKTQNPKSKKTGILFSNRHPGEGQDPVGTSKIYGQFNSKGWALACARATMVLSLVFSVPVNAQEQKLGEEKPLSETVEYEVKEKLEIQKPPPMIELNVKEIVESGTPQTETVLEATKPIPSDEDYEHYAFLDSRQVLQPWSPLIPEPPLITFQPGLSKVATKRWEFRVSDQTGEVIKTISGKGVPPRLIEWNGLTDRGQYINVGTLYSYQFVTFDEHGNAHTFPGEPFQLDAVMYKQKKRLYVEFANDNLFVEDTADFNPTMRGLWARAQDILRQYSNKPITVEIHADSVKSPLVEDRRQVVINDLSDATNIMAVDIRHRIEKATDRGRITRLVMYLK